MFFNACPGMLKVSEILWPLQTTVLETAKRNKRPNLDNPISLAFWGGETACPEQKYSLDARSKQVAKFQVLSSEQPQVTLPVVTSHHAGPQTLFKSSN